jgi:hypothetical protein
VSGYDYVRAAYGVNPVVGERVRLEGPGRREGVIAREKLSAAHYIYVRFDGASSATPCHPRSLDYLGATLPQPSAAESETQ